MRRRVRIYYEMTVAKNQKYTLVFLHGMGGDLTAWESVRNYFCNLGYPTLALDLRGFGLSERPKDEQFYQLKNFVEDVVNVIKKENLRKLVGVGHCFGGMVIMTLAGLHLDKLSALILVATSYKPPFFIEPIAKHNFLKTIFSFVAERASFSHIHKHADFNKFIGTTDFDWKRIASDIKHTSLKSYLLVAKNMLYFDASPFLKKISVPTLIIAGAEDRIYPPKIAEKMHQLIKNSQLKLIPKANHLLILNNPRPVVNVIKKFLNKIF